MQDAFIKFFFLKCRHACMIVFAAEISERPRGVTIFTPACTLTLLPPSQLAPHYVGVCFFLKYWLCTCCNLQVARSCSCQSLPIYIQYPWKLILNFMAPTALLQINFHYDSVTKFLSIYPLKPSPMVRVSVL